MHLEEYVFIRKKLQQQNSSGSDIFLFNSLFCYLLFWSLITILLSSNEKLYLFIGAKSGHINFDAVHVHRVELEYAGPVPMPEENVAQLRAHGLGLARDQAKMEGRLPAGDQHIHEGTRAAHRLLVLHRRI
jgi:hypothetical protein